MGVLFECVGELTESKRSMSRSAGRGVNSLCANEESSFKSAWQRFNLPYLFLMENLICERFGIFYTAGTGPCTHKKKLGILIVLGGEPGLVNKSLLQKPVQRVAPRCFTFNTQKKDEGSGGTPKTTPHVQWAVSRPE